MGLALIQDDASSRFDGVLDYIDQHLGREICLTDLASAVGLSVTRFSHAFKAAHGVAPYQYITQRRVDRARTLLTTTAHTIAAIAAQLGFSSQSRFSQIFVRFTGATPSTYRAGRALTGRGTAFLAAQPNGWTVRRMARVSPIDVPSD